MAPWSKAARPSRCRDDIKHFFGNHEVSEGDNIRSQSIETVSIWLGSLSPRESRPPPHYLRLTCDTLLKRKAAVEVNELASTLRARAKGGRANPPPSPPTHVLVNSTWAKISGKQPPYMRPEKKQPRSGIGVDTFDQDEEVEPLHTMPLSSEHQLVMARR